MEVEQLQALINSLPGMVFRCSYDRDLTFEYVSDGAKALLGYEPSDLIRINAFRKLVHPEDQMRNKAILAKLSPDNPRYEMIYRMRTLHGEDKWVKEQGLAIYAKNGELTIIHGILTDVTAEKIAEMELRTENRLLRVTRKDRYRLGKLIGKSPVMQRVYDMILKAAANKDANVLIIGESGTGKELAARAIHDLSERSRNAFVAVNCGAIPENLIESEFFGHSKGAFSGAIVNKKGYLEAAEGGTLLLDEIGEIPLSLQIKLLRAIEEKSFLPVGSHILKRSDFRIIAATNRDLTQLVNKGQMRTDFYFRINVIPIKMPALRERKEDIPLLVESFLERAEGGADKALFPTELLRDMRRHEWPGNVRELKNVLERYITMGELSYMETLIPIEKSPGETSDRSGQRLVPPRLGSALRESERDIILQALDECHWKKGLCAEKLGISWRTLQRKLKKYEIT